MVNQPLSSPRRQQLLRILADASEPLTYAQLAEEVGVSSGTVFSILKRPARAGWVKGTIVPNSPKPGVVTKLTLTDAGRQYLESLTDTDRGREHTVSKPITPEMIAAWRTLQEFADPRTPRVLSPYQQEQRLIEAVNVLDNSDFMVPIEDAEHEQL
jgi:DNA-binding MarR family transcriptional regulator